MPVPSFEQLIQYVEFQQELYWDELYKAIDSAVNGAWSIHCSSIASRIIQSARLTGPSYFTKVQWPLVAGNVYHDVLVAGKIDPPDITIAEWVDMEQTMMKHFGDEKATVMSNTARYLETRRAIRDERETLFLQEGQE